MVSEWCAPIVVTPKKGTDKIRMCVDLSRLNRFVKRERYQSATPAEAVADIAEEKAKMFTKFVALKGYNVHYTVWNIQVPSRTIRGIFHI